MDQNLPDFPSIDIPDFGGTGASGNQQQNTPQSKQGGQITQPVSLPGAPAGSDGFGGGNAAAIGSVPELASLDGSGGDSDKKKTTMIIIGGVAALVISVVFVGLYFYFQGGATSSTDDLLVPQQPRTQQASQQNPPQQDGETASPSADTDDPVASAPARPRSTPEPTAEPEPYEGEYFATEMPGDWEIEEKTPRGIYVEEVDINIFTTVASEQVRVGIVKIQVSDELIANKFDEDKYEVLYEQEISIDTQPAELIEYQIADSEEANPITNVLTYHNDMTYRISFTANKNYEQADELRNEFLKMIIAFTLPEKTDEPQETAEMQATDEAKVTEEPEEQ